MLQLPAPGGQSAAHRTVGADCRCPEVCDMSDTQYRRRRLQFLCVHNCTQRFLVPCVLTQALHRPWAEVLMPNAVVRKTAM